MRKHLTERLLLDILIIIYPETVLAYFAEMSGRLKLSIFCLPVNRYTTKRTFASTLILAFEKYRSKEGQSSVYLKFSLPVLIRCHEGWAWDGTASPKNLFQRFSL